jgi:stress-induced morphogen
MASNENGAQRKPGKKARVSKSRKRTRETARIESVLREHFPDTPAEYPPEAYRFNPASIRVRLVSPTFRGKEPMERFDMVAAVLRENLAEETWWDVMYILSFTPEEVKAAPANRVFEDAVPFWR